MLDFTYCPTLAELLRDGKAIGQSGRVIVGDSLSTANNLATIRNLLLDLRPERTLEIGMGLGASSLAFTASHAGLGRRPNGQHLAIDPFQTTVWDNAGRMAVDRAGLRSFLDFHGDMSALVLPQLRREGRQIDMSYVDGSHLFEDVFVDLYYLTLLTVDRGLVVFDDSTNPHVRKVIRFVRVNLFSDFEEVDLSPFRPDGNTMKYRLARRLGRVQMRAFRRLGTKTRDWDARFVDF